MKEICDKAIVIRRLNYGESDRIVTFLTKDAGRQVVMTKGTRKQGSKLAGGVELFCESEVTIIPGRGEMGILRSARISRNFHKDMLTDLKRVMWGYAVLKLIDKFSQHQADEELYKVLLSQLMLIGNSDLELNILKVVFYSQLLNLAGQMPNLYEDLNSNKLQGESFAFDYDGLVFEAAAAGSFTPDHLKFLRLLAQEGPFVATKINGAEELVVLLLPLLKSLVDRFIDL